MIASMIILRSIDASGMEMEDVDGGDRHGHAGGGGGVKRGYMYQEREKINRMPVREENRDRMRERGRETMIRTYTRE